MRAFVGRAAVFAVSLVGCGGGSSAAPSGPKLAIVTASGAPLHGVAGDALPLKVVLQEADGSTQPLPAGAVVTWTSPDPVTALPAGSSAASPLPPAGTDPTAAWVANPGRADRSADLSNVLFLLDPGSVQNGTVRVAATVTGVSEGSDVAAEVGVDPTPAGDWTNGAALYGSEGASCALCHGDTGHGSPGAPSDTSYTMAGKTYDFPAPGLNAEPGNAGGDPAWNAALFAFAARADVDNGGVTLRLPMPDWLTANDPATSQPLSTQDFADIYAFLKTQTH